MTAICLRTVNSDPLLRAELEAPAEKQPCHMLFIAGDASYTIPIPKTLIGPEPRKQLAA